MPAALLSTSTNLARCPAAEATLAAFAMTRPAILLLLTAIVSCSRESARASAGTVPVASRPHSLAQAQPQQSSKGKEATFSVQTAEPRPAGGEVTVPVAIKRVEPNFTACEGKRLWGFPILEAVIDETGHVKSLKFLKPVHPCLEAAILPALRQWRFKPGTYKGKPVPVQYNLTVNIHYR